MAFKDIFDPKQLTILTDALDAFCNLAGIEKGTPEHDRAGVLVLSLFRRGATTPQALRTALAAAFKNGRDDTIDKRPHKVGERVALNFPRPLTAPTFAG